jgi:hypothetical protein
LIAVIETGRPKPCVVKWTGRKGLHVSINTYCGKTVNAKDGVLQVPDKMKVCEECQIALNVINTR